ncbi:MAG: glycosyl transferase [Fluviicola sp.]|nr:MAG: glycosyl transferase [Fluviicola sp.]
MKISIIIPTLNEEEKLPQLLDVLSKYTYTYEEIIIVDAKSTDKTVEIAKSYPKVNVIEDHIPSRAKQMNTGANAATGEIFYFIHADVIPPNSFEDDIRESIKKGVDVGCYRFQFDKNALPLKFNAWWTRFDFMFCRGGDQTLFVKKSVFNELDGFDPEYVIMEDFDFIRRARKNFKFKIIPKDVLVSARKYEHNSYFKVNVVNLWSYWTFMLGGSPERIKMNYKKWLKFES